MLLGTPEFHVKSQAVTLCPLLYPVSQNKKVFSEPCKDIQQDDFQHQETEQRKGSSSEDEQSTVMPESEYDCIGESLDVVMMRSEDGFIQMEHEEKFAKHSSL